MLVKSDAPKQSNPILLGKDDDPAMLFGIAGEDRNGRHNSVETFVLPDMSLLTVALVIQVLQYEL